MSNSTPNVRPDATEALASLLRERILVIDGAMGTMIQRHTPGEAEYRGERFKEFHLDVKGNSDLLVLTQPEMIRGIHEEYLEAGADIVETNTFGATTIAQADFEMESLAYEMNVAGARLAREACDRFSTPERRKLSRPMLNAKLQIASYWFWLSGA